MFRKQMKHPTPEGQVADPDPHIFRRDVYLELNINFQYGSTRAGLRHAGGTPEGY
jgi:hypothetical protein